MPRTPITGNMNIGVFDSGFGGLTILRALTKHLPQYDYVYLGDTARVPYGNRSQETIYNFTKQAIDFLFEQDCELVLIACNTASSKALRKLQQEHLERTYPDRRILGVIIPTVEHVVQTTKTNRVGLMGTEGTVTSKTFDREFEKLNPRIKLFSQSCPLLVPYIESGEKDPELLTYLLEKYVGQILINKVDVIVCGCTHYELISDQLSQIIDDKIHIVTQGKIVAEKLKTYLRGHPEIEKKLNKKQRRTFYTTDLTEYSESLGSTFFGKTIYPQSTIIG